MKKQKDILNQMAKHTTATNQRLVSLSRFMQILDGTFPSGIFVHSFGLEPHIIKWIVKDITTLRVYLNNLILDQYMRLEFVIVKKIYEDLKNEKMNKIYSLDNSYSSFLSYEYTKASTNIGFNYYTQLKSQVSKTVVKKYFDALETKKCDGNELIVLATYAFDLDIDFEDFIVMWCKKNLINISATALKISRIKPSEIQQMLFEFDEILGNIEFEKLSDKITNFNPLFEEVIFSHKNLEPKMFVT